MNTDKKLKQTPGERIKEIESLIDYLTVELDTKAMSKDKHTELRCELMDLQEELDDLKWSFYYDDSEEDLGFDEDDWRDY